MKVHCINILLFALPLNVLEHNKNKPRSTPHNRPKIPTTRLLCECELYAPVNYDDDPQMKEVMDNFNKQTQQRFHEYDERMIEKRKQCKEHCDKEIQKIILKDKLEKQMAQQLTTLETKINTHDIPTCICEKSIADKVEKGCLRCGGVFGGGVAPSVGLIGTFAVDQLTNAARAAAIELATQEGMKVGVQAVITKIDDFFRVMLSGVKWQNFITESNYSTASGIFEGVKNAATSIGKSYSGPNSDPVLSSALSNWKTFFDTYVTAGKDAAAATTKSVKTVELGKVAAESTPLYNAIGYSVLAILIIVLIMVIIYLVLCYRRKKKMKKKLQYIKLLEE
ncbi:rifin [Plasmodium reichenowi]|uniref:Rifin n=1 Tax=Plasmodium reichenowi TaxID=5854 RepID=A0A060RMB0_PLARE|nr:rifin [Plasmodium reichenowi]